MGPTHRLWKARASLFGRMLKYVGGTVSGTFGKLSKKLQQLVIHSDGAIFPIAVMLFVIVFMLDRMITENKGRKPATAAMVVEYRAKNECLHGLIPKIAQENNGAPLLTKQIWKANEDCAKAMADLAEKQALDKALAK